MLLWAALVSLLNCAAPKLTWARWSILSWATTTTYKMASPNTSGSFTPKKKDESFLDKLGTMGRKKKAKEGIVCSLVICKFINYQNWLYNRQTLYNDILKGDDYIQLALSPYKDGVDLFLHSKFLIISNGFYCNISVS